MDAKRKVTLLMAAYNEEQNIDNSLETLHKYAQGNIKDFELIVVGRDWALRATENCY